MSVDPVRVFCQSCKTPIKITSFHLGEDGILNVLIDQCETCVKQDLEDEKSGVY